MDSFVDKILPIGNIRGMKRRRNRNELIQRVNQKLVKKPKKYPEFKVGDTVRVFVRVTEGEKTRLQPFEGIVIKKRGGGVQASFTVRKVSAGIGIERIFPYYSPVIDRIMLVSEGEVRRAKLYYLRGLKGRRGKIKSEYVYRDTQVEDSTEAQQASASEAGEQNKGDVSAKAAGA